MAFSTKTHPGRLEWPHRHGRRRRRTRHTEDGRRPPPRRLTTSRTTSRPRLSHRSRGDSLSGPDLRGPDPGHPIFDHTTIEDLGEALQKAAPRDRTAPQAIGRGHVPPSARPPTIVLTVVTHSVNSCYSLTESVECRAAWLLSELRSPTRVKPRPLSPRSWRFSSRRCIQLPAGRTT